MKLYDFLGAFSGFHIKINESIYGYIVVTPYNWLVIFGYEYTHEYDIDKYCNLKTYPYLLSLPNLFV